MSQHGDTGHPARAQASGTEAAPRSCRTRSDNELVFVKLGGSVITDKTKPESARATVIARLAGEIAQARAQRPGLQLIVGHGSGSFGHVTAQEYGTRQGVRSTLEWHGFAQVAAIAARLNRLVTEAFLAAGVPVWSLQPSASARCQGGDLVALAVEPVEHALAHGIVPLLYGDVSLDTVQGGTIISTEEILAYLARRLRPARLILAGAVEGVFTGDPLLDSSVDPVPEISAENWTQVRAALSGSHATDVTGGMLSKIEEMVALVQDLPGLTVRLISGQHSGLLQAALLDPERVSAGTVIRWAERP